MHRASSGGSAASGFAMRSRAGGNHGIRPGRYSSDVTAGRTSHADAEYDDPEYVSAGNDVLDGSACDPGNDHIHLIGGDRLSAGRPLLWRDRQVPLLPAIGDPWFRPLRQIFSLRNRRAATMSASGILRSIPI